MLQATGDPAGTMSHQSTHELFTAYYMVPNHYFRSQNPCSLPGFRATLTGSGYFNKGYLESIEVLRFGVS
jgi:hypothetical protein